MYACVVKNSQNTWDIYGFASYPTAPEKQANLEAAVESGLPITGMILTPYKWAATTGATWDGTGFTGGPPSVIPQDIDWNSIETYGYLCNNVIIYANIGNTGTVATQQMNAIFAGDSEINIIKIPEGQTARVGDIWDGQNVINK
jgi:hypothetical protein